MIGKIKRVGLRDVWKHEAFDFTQWLEDNIEVLSDVLPFSLANPEREQSVGTFNVDLVAEDDSGNLVVIENQLERSDHDHLGKLLTYSTSIGSKTAIWIVAEPRPEHITAVTWLNESSDGNFYLIKLEAVRIGDSPPAPLLTVIVGPSDESKVVGETKKELAERYRLRHKFWTKLLELARPLTKLHANISPSQYNWIGASSGKRGLSYNYGMRKHDTLVELYIDRGKEAEEENKRIFDELYQHRSEIEESFGGPLEWQRLEGKRACRIMKRYEGGGYRDEDKWPSVHEKLVNAMISLEKALKPYVSKVQT